MSQNKQIIEYLKSGKSITQMEALHYFGCARLASRISDLRKVYPIKAETVAVTKADGTKAYVCKYSLRAEE